MSATLGTDALTGGRWVRHGLIKRVDPYIAS